MIYEPHLERLRQLFHGNIPAYIEKRCKQWAEAMELIEGRRPYMPVEILALILADYASQLAAPAPPQEPPRMGNLRYPDANGHTNGHTNGHAKDAPLGPSWAKAEQQTERPPESNFLSFENASQVLDDNGSHPLDRPYVHSPEPQPLTAEKLQQIAASGKAVPVSFSHPRHQSIANGLLVGEESGMAVIKTSEVSETGEPYTGTVHVALEQVRV